MRLKNNAGYLYSSDFPYFRLAHPERYIGLLVQGNSLKIRWDLDIRGDSVALPEIADNLNHTAIDLFHYDSDKSYSGRDFALFQSPRERGKRFGAGGLRAGVGAHGAKVSIPS